MNKRTRMGSSALISIVLALSAYLLPYTPLVYFFAPGFWLSDALPDWVVNILGGYLFSVFASVLIWTLLIFSAWLLMAKRRDGSKRQRR
jgi:hypothetical protein